MMRSRVTLAMIEAAAIEKQRPSPPTTVVNGTFPSGNMLPSTSKWSGTRVSFATASCMARKVAFRIFIASIISCDTIPTPTENADCMMRSKSSSRCAGVSFLESSTPGR